ncbi:MAG: hypothetical protein ACI8RH_001059, partial [Flavobacteriales bacterium]
MKKLLLVLLGIFSMFAAKAQCDYTINGTDSYGDGWNGASIEIDVAGATTQFIVTAGSNSLTIPSFTGDAVTFAFTSGTWDNEIGITITGPDGTSLYDEGAPTLDGIFVTDTSVSTCAPPSCTDAYATMSAITATGATATWAAANGAVSYDWEVVPTGNAQG